MGEERGGGSQSEVWGTPTAPPVPNPHLSGSTRCLCSSPPAPGWGRCTPAAPAPSGSSPPVQHSVGLGGEGGGLHPAAPHPTPEPPWQHLLALLEHVGRAVLGQGLVVEVHSILVALLLEVRVADAGVRSVLLRRGGGSRAALGAAPPKTCPPTPAKRCALLRSLGDLPVVLPVLPAHLDGFFAQLTAPVVVALLEVDGCRGESGGCG